MSNMEPLIQFVNESYGAERLCEILDNVAFGYFFALCADKNSEIDKHEVQEQISALYQLRNALRKCC